MSPSLRRLGVHSSLFPKKRRGDLGPGKEGGGGPPPLSGETLTEIPSLSLATRQLSLAKTPGRERFCARAGAFDLNRGHARRAIPTEVGVVSCAPPAQRYYVATTMDRIIIGEKSNVVNREEDDF